LQPAILAAEVPAGSMQPLRRRIRGDLEHGSDVDDLEVLPRHEPEHLGVGVTEAGDRLENELALIAIQHRLVRAGRGTIDHAAHPDIKSASPRRGPPLVADDPVGDSVQPHQRRIPSGHIVEATPRREKHLAHGIIDDILGHATAAIVADRSVETTVDLVEPEVLT
jgi:hypothetical protein